MVYQDLERMRHSAAHVMAEAVLEFFPGAKLAIGPAIEEGFYYDFDLPRSLTPDDLAAIEARMRKGIAANRPFVRREIHREEARAIFADQPYKQEIVEEIPEGEAISTYQHGSFVDLCAGPHLESTGQIGPFKLLNVAGAYWRGDEKRPMLQRIYGTAWNSQEELDRYLWKLEEIAKRDHRKLGRELDLFSVHEEIGAGLIHWHPKGTIIRDAVEDFWKAEHIKRGYQLVCTPHIASEAIYRRSGHLEMYSDLMYGAMDIDGALYRLKPMNCPGHILIYKTRTRSYRDLPIRYAELGTVYRYERSGVLHGMLRVRGFTQDDAHLFCRPDQLEEELIGVIDLAEFMMRTFGYGEYDIELSVRDPENKSKYIGDDEVWDKAESALVAALKSKDLPYKRVEGEAKFYGPSIDIKVKDALGRGWQGPTIQCDFNQPNRFDINYVGEDGQEHRVVMIHRTVLGAMERFIGGLTEHYVGAFPIWLAPVQAVVIPIADRHLDYARQVERRLKEAGLRVQVDDRSERMNLKIRDAQLQKIPYMLVVGDREAISGAVAVRLRSEENLGAQPLPEFVAMAREAVEAKRIV
ncbi:MAG: threonine--tRNA ligase [Chloroflexi bacterium]|nr:threonine--tRNA ligase [Chloroflexota bacterium]